MPEGVPGVPWRMPGVSAETWKGVNVEWFHYPWQAGRIRKSRVNSPVIPLWSRKKINRHGSGSMPVSVSGRTMGVFPGNVEKNLSPVFLFPHRCAGKNI